MTQILFEGCAPSTSVPELIGRRVQCPTCNTVFITDWKTDFTKPDGYTKNYYQFACPKCEAKIDISTVQPSDILEKDLKELRQSMYGYVSDGGKGRRELSDRIDSLSFKMVILCIVLAFWNLALTLGLLKALEVLH